MDDEAQKVIDEMDGRETPTEHFGRWWVEYFHGAVLAEIVDETKYRLQAFNRKTGVMEPFVFDIRSLWDKEWTLPDEQKIAAALYVRASIVLDLYTKRERDVSVNTLTRNRPRAFCREGDSLRFSPLESLASAAGQHRQRGYVRPDEASGIRMREHDVRGHWRTFPSGVRVWVRPHKRGDAELGQVKRVLT